MNQFDPDQAFREYGPMVSTLARRLILNHEVASEAAQEVWYEIIKSAPSYKNECSLSTWIYTIAKRTISRYLKNEITYSSYEINHYMSLEPIDYTDNEKEKREWVKEKCDHCLTAFCHCLNNEARLIFLFHQIVNLSYNQISEIMELKEENIRKIASRSRAKVKNFMENNCILYNPRGNCRCRIRQHIKSVKLDLEYSKLEKAAQLTRFYLKFEKDLPRQNYWIKIIT
ncbi:sigma-70 family RNA polymerase sigma factor [Marinilabiliaceae bacterium JC017]|nr:sigma-70 family RNA polymerase sigma factor [Marinilabiliaceae bacterium JC017]